MFEDVSHYFILQMMNENSKRLTADKYEKLSESGRLKLKVGDVPVSYIKQIISNDKEGCEIEFKLEFMSLQNAIEEVKSLKCVEFRNDIPVFEV